MSSQRTVAFRWRSPLGFSVALFQLYGFALSFALGIQWEFIAQTSGGDAVITSPGTDTVVFGEPPAAVYRDNPALRTVDRSASAWRDGVGMCLGIGVMALTWFGLRKGERWALWTLTLIGLGMLPYAVLYMRPVFNAHAPWGLLDPPPMLTFQALVVPIAVLLAWIGQPRRAKG